MSTTSRTTATALTASTVRSTYTTPLKSYFVAGNTINAIHFALLRDFVNAVVGHTHTLQEWGRIADYGNTGSTNGPYTQTTTTPNSKSTVSLSLALGTGGTITAADHNVLRNGAAQMSSHDHNFEDTVN